MTRLITTHALRRATSPSPLWTLSAPGMPDFVPVITCVPGDARTVPGLECYEGLLVYEKKLTCAGTLRMILHGTDGHARMLLDDTLIGEGKQITALVEDIEYAQHTLRIEIEGGHGLIRPVTVEQMGGAYITDMKVLPRQQGRMWLCDITVTIRSLSDAELPMEVEISAGPARTRWEDQVLPAGATVTLKRTVPAPGVKRWSPKNPHLYPASCILWLDGEPADDMRDRFGFRTAEWDGSKILLNGKTIEGTLLRRHEHCGLTGYSVPAEVLVRDVQLLRAMDCAAVTAGDDGRFLDACDELGLCVMAKEAIGNHPCVVICGETGSLPLFADTDTAFDGVLDAFRNAK